MSDPEVHASPLAGRRLGDDRSTFLLAERTVAPGGAWLAPLHVHHTEDEAWYVLAGRLAFRLGERILEAGAGDAVFGPRGVPHTLWNPGPDPVRYLVVMGPRTAELVQRWHRLTDRDPERVRVLFREYDCEFLGVEPAV